MKGVTKSGFEFSVDPVVFNDMELIDMWLEVKQGADGILTMGPIIKKILGQEAAKSLYTHCRMDDGRVPIDAVEKELEEIIGAVMPKKT